MPRAMTKSAGTIAPTYPAVIHHGASRPRKPAGCSLVDRARGEHERPRPVDARGERSRQLAGKWVVECSTSMFGAQRFHDEPALRLRRPVRDPVADGQALTAPA